MHTASLPAARTAPPFSGRILVTGGAGFIGSALIWELNQRGLTNILVSDILGSDEKWRNLTPLRFADYVEAPAFRAQLAEHPESFGKFSAIFHLGACSATTERDASYLIDNNYTYTKELARWALAHKTRFVYASSAATYGDGTRGMDDRSDELPALRPLNMYGYSKHLFDLHAQREGWLQSIVGLKYFNVFGPNEDHKADMRSLVNKAYQQIEQSGSVGLFKSYRPDYADGEQQRDFLYVKDAVAMTLFLAEGRLGDAPVPNSDRPSGLFNLGSGEANTWLTLTRAIFAALGREPQINFIDMPESLRGKYQYHTRADIGKLRDAGYSAPVTPLADSVRDYVQNYLRPAKKLGE
ncbi:ADP-L-glycero-D-mannoheptose-6-epimerase [Cephaloticoccus capnophilus]|uniref:ADP-L-glycero-D-manno-heptose-6-epimerase n=1 Tax=Cephaloticoccus capnophilus TaxID=1548208 RepID=A0A139SHL0_9BACT|nr:ADP-glyceromanno-heptose 6-epimerase [Cephaloticoccus capnophilus]KXU34023.1 ADP-L-glycero-D-mannoheptose-6-epimerase [Cephaloticoccus capnophilus]